MIKQNSFIAILVFIQATFAFAQGEHSGGGGYREEQFKNIGYELVEFLDGAKNIPAKLNQIPWKALREVIRTTKVEATHEKLFAAPGGIPEPSAIKDMINVPGKKKIVINIDSWDTIPNGSGRASLVLHEYLGILKYLKKTKLDDTHYEISRYVYELPALKLIFDHSETAQSLSDVPLDFPISCTYQYKTLPIKTIGKFGTFYTMGDVETQNKFNVTNIEPNSIKSPFLQLMMYDRSDDTLQAMGMVPKDGKTGIRFIVAWNKQLGTFPTQKDIVFDQTVAVSPNFKVEFNIPQVNLRIECKRVPMKATKPKDLR